jgi:hypothetical protein
MTAVPLPSPDTSRRSVLSVSNYQAAEHAVDWLSDMDFPVERVSIVGTGLRYVEQVSGRRTTGRAVLNGLAQGIWIGLVFALLFDVFFALSTGGFFGLLAYGIVAGAFFGALWGAFFQSLRRGRRDFDSVAQTRADCYEVQVDVDVADEAERLIRRMSVAA